MRSRLLLTALLGMLAVATVQPSALAQPPVVRYLPEGNRQLIFVNNPERLEIGIPGT